MKKLGWITAAAMSLALTAPVGAAEAKYVIECVTRAVEQANAAGDYSGYGAATNSFCVLGGWLATGEQLQYSFSMTKGKSYLIVGAGDGDVKDLDLSVSDGTDAVEDTEDDNTPWVHVKAERGASSESRHLREPASGAASRAPSPPASQPSPKPPATGKAQGKGLPADRAILHAYFRWLRPPSGPCRPRSR